jgi:hypothetical protein
VGSGGQNDPRLRLWFNNGHILYLNPSYTSKRHQERSCPPGVAAAASRIECCELPLECWRLFPRSALPNTPTLSPEPPSPRLAPAVSDLSSGTTPYIPRCPTPRWLATGRRAGTAVIAMPRAEEPALPRFDA